MISPNTIQQITSRIDIIDVVGEFVKLKKRGTNYLGLCPFHGEKTPSFTVSPDLQIFKCFGCGKAGDIFTFVEEYEKIEFREALELLAKRAGITLKSNPALSTAEKISQKIIIINQFTSVFYHYVLTKHP
ncbi:MAG TPA: CHC2 zinc finger domain-containing protein, partial [Sediminibacterium sp.]|nr:CHC2 zinc finger domain-containing protein [Sediminibacterium sp.]